MLLSGIIEESLCFIDIKLLDKAVDCVLFSYSITKTMSEHSLWCGIRSVSTFYVGFAVHLKLYE
jgi:hypothetical protein